MLSFIHAGDVHLGNPFTGLSQNLSPDFQKNVQLATFTALDRLVEFAVDQEVDLVLFPGDLYHGSDNSPLIQERLTKALTQLDLAGIWSAISFGNHDFQQGQQVHPTWPDRVLVFGPEVETKTITTKSGAKVAISAFSYTDRQHRQSALPDFPVKQAGVDYHLGMYHGVVGQDGENYAAFSLPDMVAKGYDYWALGHIHVRQILHRNPVVAYSGNLQGLNRNEDGEKGFFLVSDQDGQGLVPEFYPVAPVLWQRVQIQNCPDLATLQGQLNAYHWEQPTLVILELTGQVGPDIEAAARFGTLLESLQASRKSDSDYWPVKAQIVTTAANQKRPALPADVDLQAAIRQVIQADSVGQWLSDQAPTFIRDYFYSEEGQADLADRLYQDLVEGGQDED
ncbi:DNA repair exonuclease [Fructobacillus tropaeoli]|uniref:metallophosphoesterase family protein n=1 Tax=Fructobacillus tropaeoli TaxID=709323 RepID=UPI001456242C|nr:DNA repair exonuclease [Fructobacillus tropaeoli]NLS37660.1 DNA repair exonuclease [Fructobacillus tropaeoli]